MTRRRSRRQGSAGGSPPGKRRVSGWRAGRQTKSGDHRAPRAGFRFLPPPQCLPGSAGHRRYPCVGAAQPSSLAQAENLITGARFVADLECHIVAGTCLRHLLVLYLERVDRLAEVGGVALNVDLVRNRERARQLHRGHADVPEVVSDLTNELLHWPLVAQPSSNWKGQLLVATEGPGSPGGCVLNLDAALHEDRAQTIRVFEALLTPRLATQRDEDVDKGRHVLANIVVAAAAYEFAEADDKVAHLGPCPIALIRADHVCRPLVEQALGLEDGGDDPVDVASIEGVTALKSPFPRLVEHWRAVHALGLGRAGGQGRSRSHQRMRQLAQGKGAPFPAPVDSATADSDPSAASYGYGLSVDIDDACGVLIDAEDQDVVGEHRFEEAQPRLSQVAEPRVVCSAFAVVVVWDHGAAKANLAE